MEKNRNDKGFDKSKKDTNIPSQKPSKSSKDLNKDLPMKEERGDQGV
jgi:hypothetical protein